MLRKLLKYDFRANLKIFLFVWPAIIIYSIVAHLLLSGKLNSKSMYVLLTPILTVYAFAVIGIIFFSFYISARRFYTGLLGKEGYLMFTLPVKPWQLILSKFITSLTTISVTLIISAISLVLLLIGLDGFDQTSTIDSSVGHPDLLLPSLGILSFFASIASGIMQVYLACALGHQFKKRRLLWSVLMYYAINIIMQIFSSFLSLILITKELDFANVEKLLSPEASTLLTLLITLGLCVVFFFLTERLLRKKLNLE